MSRVISLFVAIVISLAGSAAMASEHSSAKDAEAFLGKAIEKIKQDGPDKAFIAFNSRDGGFVEKELYVFVFDMDGMYQASGFNPNLTGSNAQDLRDVNGKYIVQEMLSLAKTSGGGWIDYAWVNPVSGKLEHKHSLVRVVDGYMVGVGYYTQDHPK